jgi:hypothetical protein
MFYMTLAERILSGTNFGESKTICNADDIIYIWHHDEELRSHAMSMIPSAITFDFVQSILKSRPFLPRYSHCGCASKPTVDDLRGLRKKLPSSQKFMGGWREYVS